MTLLKRYGIGLIILVLLLAVAASYFFGGNQTLGSMTITDATPDQLALAMNKDEFYAEYRENTLVVHGQVAGITQQNSHTLLELKTDTLFKTFCDIDSASYSAKTGDAVTVVAEGFEAERLSNGVQLNNCRVL